jgi:hypothetical protein
MPTATSAAPFDALDVSADARVLTARCAAVDLGDTVNL